MPTHRSRHSPFNCFEMIVTSGRSRTACTAWTRMFLSRGERVQIAIAKIDQRLQALAGLKVRAKDASSSGKPMRKTDSGTDHRSNIAVVLGFSALENHFHLGGHEVIEGGNLQYPVI